jgi:hypothetical protein
MRRRALNLLGLYSLAAITACVPAPTPQQNYDNALKNLERAEARLDNLRPAYDAARERAALAVCEEIAGTTPEASAEGAIAHLETLLTDGAATTADKPLDEGTKADAKTKPPLATPMPLSTSCSTPTNKCRSRPRPSPSQSPRPAKQ